jgi:iron complex outermembrane receptor protein
MINALRSMRFLGCSALALSAVTAAPAIAQDSGGGVNEIIVTAQKRSENLQVVPAAVSVVSGAALDGGTAYNIEGIQTLVPTLNFRKGGTSLNSSLFLRGVGTINFSIAAEPSVAFVLDGVVLARAGEAFGDLYDLERIEVLRGPQGTLFGKNASAGVVNVVSRMPGDSYGGQVDVSAFEGDEVKIKAAFDAPLSDAFKTRLTVFGGRYDGNITNLTTGDKINGYDRWGVRGIALWEPSQNLSLTMIGDYRRSDDDCCGEIIGSLPAANAARPAFLSLLSGINLAGDETREVRHNFVTSTKEEAWGLSLQADLDIGAHTLTSITAYRGWDNRELREGDWLDRPAAYLQSSGGFQQLHDDGPQESTTLSQELRIASPSDQRLEYVAGLYYYRADADRLFRRDVTTCTATTLPADATGLRPCAPGASTFASDFSQAVFGSKFENVAIFGQASFDLTDALSIIAGLRYSQDDLSVYHNRTPARVALPGIRTDTTGFIDTTDAENLSGKAGAQFQFTPDIMGYATYTRGYKGPAFNVFFNQTAAQRNPIEGEDVDAYEAGFKTAWVNGRVILNLAAFRAEYQNFQANNFDTLNGVVITRLTNAGEVSTQGLEADWLLRPLDDLTITGGIAYTEAQVENFFTPPGQAQAVRPGSPLALAPEWKGSLGAEYRWRSAGAFDVLFNGQYSYTGEQFSDLGQNPLLRLEEYGIVDASIAFAAKDDRLRVTLIGRNLGDESFASLITPGGSGGALRYLIPREADRYYGISLRAKFGG